MARVYKKKIGPFTRGPDKLYETPASVALWQRFVRPFLESFTMLSHERLFEDGPAYFFNVDGRRIQWCKCVTQFKMPGAMWLSESEPFFTIEGTGKRDVRPGAALIVRTDGALPDRNEIEYADQIFVLTDAELAFVHEKLKVLA